MLSARFWVLSFCFVVSARAGAEGSDVPQPLKMPKFRDPYAGLSESDLKERIPVLEAESASLVLSREIRSVQGVPAPLTAAVDVEIVLPKNRCETGVMTWGSPSEGYTSCRVLGRGQTLFASLRELAGIRATQRGYKNWVIGQTPFSIKSEWVKNKEHFASSSRYDYCMFRPDFESNGASIHTRPNASIGHYLLDTGKKIHPGKSSWGSRPGYSRNLLPIRMTPVESPENLAYAGEGSLVTRFGFWIHSHENLKDPMPLEAHSTWGCPRLPRSCLYELQGWVAAQNAMGKLPLMVILQQ